MVTIAPNYCVVYQNDENYSFLPSVLTTKHVSLTEKFSILQTIASTIEFCHQRAIVIGQFNSRSILLHNKIGAVKNNDQPRNIFSPLLSSSTPSLSALNDSYEDVSVLNPPTPRSPLSSSTSNDDFENNETNPQIDQNNNNNNNNNNSNNNDDKKLRRTISRSPKPMKVKLLHECDIINFGKQKDFSWSKYRWLSPELIRANSPEIAYTMKSDVYTFGLLVWYLLVEQEPFHSLDDQEVAMKLESANYKIDIPKTWPVEIANLLNSCWKLKPDSRPAISSVVQTLRSFKENVENGNWEAKM